MKLKRTSNSIRNIAIGFVNRVITQIGPFLLRTLVIYKLGNEFAGLSSLFSSILQVLNLTELGLGTAIVYNMYAPIAEDDHVRIRALMNFYRKAYLAIGTLIGVVGVALLPMLPYLVHDGKVPDGIHLQTIYLIYLAGTVSSYFFGSYKRSLLLAYQRTDMDELIVMLVQIVVYIVRAAVLLTIQNYYLYILIIPIGSIVQNCIYATFVDRRYPYLRPAGKLSRLDILQLYKKVAGLFVHKLGSTISNGLDNIVISMFLGLEILGKSGNYLLIINAVLTILNIVYSSVVAGIGNLLELEDNQKAQGVFFKLSFLNLWLQSVCSACLLCLFQPFVSLWAGTKSLFPTETMLILVVYFYTFVQRKVVLTFKDAAGLWERDWLKPLVGSAANFIMNILLVQYCGINGVYLSTILSYWLIEIPWETRVLFKCQLHISTSCYFKTQMSYAVLCLIVSTACYGLVSLITLGGVAGLFLKGILCIVTSNVILIAIFWKNNHFRYYKNLFTRILKQYIRLRNV